MKKNNSCIGLRPVHAVLKSLMVMKLLLFFMLGMSIQVFANKTYSQSKISIELKNCSLIKACEEIQNKSSFRFVYGEAIAENNTKVSLSAKDASIDEVMNKLLKGTGFKYKITSENLVSIISPSASRAAPITGRVTDAAGKALAKVTVMIKGTKVGSLTDAEGFFSLEANDTDILIFNMLGYATQEKSVGTSKRVDVVLRSTEKSIDEVVVTALGIEKSARSLSYNVQKIKSDDLTNVKQTNFINSLSGKAAGVAISSSSSGVGGSAKVTLRGNRSVNGSNQPLYVIDGVPMLNSSGGQPTDIYGSGASDGGDGISNLNPEDIESLTILEGASASALYGSQAQNGVILITTKKGKVGKAEINFNSSVQFNETAYRPKFQNKYGAVATQTSGDIESWGGPITSTYDNVDKYFQTGNNIVNAINFSAGNQLAQTYFSYANTSARGITPTNKLTRHNINMRETGSFLNNKLTLDVSFNYINQTINNRPPIGVYPNPLLSLYLFPRGVDIQPYKDDYFNPELTGANRQYWLTKNGDFHQENPWWILNKEPNSAKRNRYFITGTAKYVFSNWFNLQLRANLDRTMDDTQTRRYQGTDGNLNSLGTGFFSIGNSTQVQKYADLIANFIVPTRSEDFKIGGLVGGSIMDNTSQGMSMGGSLLTADYFVASNIVALPSQPVSVGTLFTPAVLNPGNAFSTHNQLQAAFANLELSYKNWAFLTGTFRQDWSSTLAFTKNKYYNYPSIGLSLVPSEMTRLPDFISYAKVRGSYTEVGNTLPMYLTRILNSQDNKGSLVFNTAQAEVTLKPERTKTMEFGADLRFLQNRLGLNFTYYKTNTIDQFFPYYPPASSLISVAYYNAGKIQNTGYQFIVDYDAIASDRFKWKTSFNASSNRNKILEVRDPQDESKFPLTSDNYGYSSVIVKGGSYGDIYAQTFVYDEQGRTKLVGTGTTADPYKPEKSAIQFVGNPNPKFQAGWSNTFNYKNFTLNILFDGKFGGKVMSITQAYMDLLGVSEESGLARDKGGVAINGVNSNGEAVTSLDPKTYYATIGSRGSMAGAYMFDATVVRMREAALGYTLPVKNKAFKSVRLSVTGRNLFYLYKKAPYDPELTMSTSNGLSGVDAFNMPATRDFGFNLNITF